MNSHLTRDLRVAARSFLRTPRFTIPALLALALGIGATSAIFSVVRGVMLKPLPYANPDRIVVVWENNLARNRPRNVIAPSNFVEWRERNRSFTQLGMATSFRLNFLLGGQPEEVVGTMASSDLFPALGVAPALGRAYGPSEDLENNDRVIIVSHEFWRTRLGGRKRRHRHDHQYGWRTANAGRRHAGGLHAVWREDRLPDSVRLDAGRPSRDTRTRIVVRTGSASRRCLVCAGRERHESPHGATREGRPSAQHRLVDHAGARARADGRSDPAGPSGAGRGGPLRVAGRLRQRREPASGARRRSRARVRTPHCTRRRTRSHRVPDACREPAARSRRRTWPGSPWRSYFIAGCSRSLPTDCPFPDWSK